MPSLTNVESNILAFDSFRIYKRAVRFVSNHEAALFRSIIDRVDSIQVTARHFAFTSRHNATPSKRWPLPVVLHPRASDVQPYFNLEYVSPDHASSAYR